MNLNVDFMIEDIPVVLKALPVTLALAIVSLIGAILLAVIAGTIIIKNIIALKQIIIGLNSFIKGVPLIVQLLLCYYAIPYLLSSFDGFLGYKYDPKNASYFWFAVVAFSINYGAYLTDVVISSYRAVGIDQIEAALSIGMTKWQSLSRIVIPQALKVALPNLINYFMWLLKATSLASIVNVFELLAVARASTAVNYAILEGYLVAAGIYWIVCIIAENIMKGISGEKKWWKFRILKKDLAKQMY